MVRSVYQNGTASAPPKPLVQNPGSTSDKAAILAFRFVTTKVAPDLAAKLDKHHVTLSGEIPSTWLADILSWVIPTALFFGLWLSFIRRFGQGASGLMAIGKSRAKVYVEKDSDFRRCRRRGGSKGGAE
jgi:cell division protease FtsH